MARNPRGSARSAVGVLEPTEASMTHGVKDQVAPPPSRRQHESGPEALDSETTGDPLYPVALLKIAMAMRRLGPEEELHFESILEDVLRDLTLDREAFRTYLDRNVGRLMAAVRARGY